jgi:twinkle protein
MSRLDDLANKLLSDVDIPNIDYEKYYKASDDDSKKLRIVADYFDEIEDFVENGETMKGAKLPFVKLNDLFGFRGGEVTLWSGYNGHKKSMLLGYAVIEILRQGEKACIASLEMKPISTITRMTRQYCKTAKANYDDYANFMSFTARNLYIFNHLGGINKERLYGIITYAAKELGVKHFVIDSLMRVIAGEDNYNEQKDFVVELCNIAQKQNCHIHLVHHTKKGTRGEGTPSGRYDAKGSGAISDNVHNSLIVWANKDNAEDMPDVILKCDKQREGEWEGILALNFDNETLSFEQKYNDDIS